MENKLFARVVDSLLYMGDILILFFVFIFVNISALNIPGFMGNQFPDVALFGGDAWKIAPGCGLVVILMIAMLFIKGELKSFARAWLQNYLLIFFLLFSLVSLLWTVYLPATLYELMLLFFSTIAGSYLAIRYRLSGSVKLMTGIAAFCVLASLYLVFFTDYGVMQNKLFVGSWHGLFWHRNHTGSLMAFFNMIFLVRLLMDGELSVKGRRACGALYLLTALHVFGSRSATGILIYIFLNMASITLYIWTKWREKLTPKHYYSFVLIVAAGFTVFITNLGFFFGLLGRTANMTGRTPLWEDLFFNFYLKKPFLGYGYGALWMQESFRVLMQTRHGWFYPVYFADNGFFDILLNLGIVGLVLFMIMLLITIFRNVQKIRLTHSWRYIFTFLVLFYIIISNLTYSFLLEVDHFVWMWLIVVVFLLQMQEREVSQVVA